MQYGKLALPSLRKILHQLLVLSLVLNILAWFSTQGARAANPIKVNSTADSLASDGQCTLREAIIAANKNAPSGSKKGECTAGSGADIIQIPAGLVVTLTRTDNGTEDASSTGDLDIIGDLTIEALGAGVIVRGATSFTDHVFQAHSGNVIIRNITIMGGASGNDGGAVYNRTSLTLEGVTITGNTAAGKGAGIFNATTGKLTVTNSTVANNTSRAAGGGLFNAGTASLNNLTITANTADVDGGGIAAQGGMLSVWNTIVAGNIDRNTTNNTPDCFALLSNAGYNLIGNSTGCVLDSGAPGILTGLNPGLGALQNNGGYTQTYALLDGSPSIDAANPAMAGSGGNACLALDQRGAYRPRGIACDIGAFEAGMPNSSLLIRAFSTMVSNNSGTTTAVGRLSSSANVSFKIQFYTASTCSPTTGATAVGNPVTVTTDSNGDAFFNVSLTSYVAKGQYLWAITMDPNGVTSAPSRCVRVGSGNDSWPTALRIDPNKVETNYSVDLQEFIDLQGQSRWYKFTAQPNSKLIITLTGLTENYDLTLYKDISKAFKSLTAPEDLLRLGAEFAPEAFSPEAFSPEAFSPEAFSPEAFSPEAFSPEAFSPEAFSPEAFSPEAFSPEAFSPEAFSADAYSPEAFSPEAFSPEAFSPEAFSPEAFSPEAFSSAQSRSLIGISAFNGLTGEGLMVNTWDSKGDFYIRVRGRNGAFSTTSPFRLVVRQIPGECGQVSSAFPASTFTPAGGNFMTLILSNLSAIEGTEAEKAALQIKLQTFAARPEVRGKILDFSQDDRYQAARSQAVQYATCPAAMNLAAGTIKETVDAYWKLNPDLKYLVIVGNDSVIPFFRHADHSLLGNEKNYVPPVQDNTASQASLKLGYVLSQDNYGARIEVSLKEGAIPMPELAVGRLVETAVEAAGMLDAYLSTPNGVVDTPASAFVSGYDFLDDVATQVELELQAGLSTDDTDVVNSLITGRDIAPADPRSWTAQELRSSLFGQSYDLVFLAGHFSASGALAADFTTRLQTSDLLASQVDLRNALVYSVGCHSGYNIVNDHGVPFITREPDWAQAFARKQATLIAGTGYQYGDTDFIRYSEKLYLDFTRELRVGTGPVSFGEALVRAKQNYLATTPYLRGIDEKAVLEATLFGLPMLSVNMPGERLAQTGKDPSVPGTQLYPGTKLGLEYADLNVATSAVTQVPVAMTNVVNSNQTSQATYYLGPDGAASGPNEPVLPLFQYNVSVQDKVMRGVGFRSGSYVDMDNVLPFTGAPATEIRGVHTPFQSSYFFPVQTWLTNYFSALSGGDMLLNVFPVQYRSTSPASILSTERKYSSLGFRLFYSSNIASYGSGSMLSTPALSAAPSIIKITSQVDGDVVKFQVRVTGNPAAGIEEVWVTYTGEKDSAFHGNWNSVDLIQNPADTTLWEGTLSITGVSADEVRYVVQAVNGVGLVSMDTNQGSYYIPGFVQGNGAATSLSLVTTSPGDNPSSGRYTEAVSFSAKLSSNGLALPGKPVAFILGPQSRIGITNVDGLASVAMSIYGLPGLNDLKVSFAGDTAHQPSVVTSPFTVERQWTQISLHTPASEFLYPEDEVLLTATLQDITGRYLGEETLFFVVEGEGKVYYEAVITDYLGRAPIGKLPLPPGNYTVKVYFSGIVPLYKTITLTDDRYEPASYLTGTLVLTNRPPVPANDSYMVDEDSVLSVSAPGVLGNDSDPEGKPLTASLVSGTSHGTLALSADGSFTYQPQTNYYGNDTFSYRTSDGQAYSPEVTVAITVNPLNDAPVALPDSYIVNEDVIVAVPAAGILTNDTDVEGDTMTAVLVSGPSHGSLDLNPDGSFSYVPDPDYNGSDSFMYQASDGTLLSAPALVSFQINSVNDAPLCGNALPTPDSLWTPNNQLVRVRIINITDPEDNSFAITIDRIFQDEPVGNVPDAYIYGSEADIRAERDGNGNGRVYHIFITVTDSHGAVCTDDVGLGVVSHDQSSNLAPIDDGPLYDSTKPTMN